MADIYDWSTTAADNDDADSTINWLEGQLPGTVNGSARAMMKRVKELLNDLTYSGTVGGTADAITLTSAIGALADNKVVTFRASADNTGAATLAVNGLTAKAIRKISAGADVALSAGDIEEAVRYVVVYDSAANSSAGAWIIVGSSASVAAATTTAAGIVELATNAETLAGTDTSRAVTPSTLYFPTGHLYGLTLSNNGSDAVNDIDIAAGTARDGSDTVNMLLASALTKRLDASWTVGTNQGMLDGSESSAGTPDTSTWYHIWLIKRSDTGVVDVLASESATAPTMPSNYDYKRRIGAVYNNSSGDILAFDQYGDTFIFDSPVLDASTASSGTTAVSLTLTVPLGVVVEALINTLVSSGVYFSSLASTDLATSETVSPLLSNWDSANANAGQVSRLFTNTSSQIRYRAHSNAVLRVATLGWVDRRGRT